MHNKGLIIAIVGTIGSGKTTLGQKMADIFSWEFFEEDWQNNPYITGEAAKNASQLDISLGFLNMRYEQYQKALQVKKGNNVAIIDTVFEMTDIYSKKTLSPKEYERFRQTYNTLKQSISEPDVIIYLHGDHDIFIERAQKRDWGIEIENQLITKDIIQALDEMIRKYLQTNNDSKILPYNSSHIDIRKDKNIHRIAEDIQKLHTK